MPYVMNPHKLWVKDPEHNAYLPQNVIATQTAEEQIALVEAAGADTIADVQQAVADSQAAVNSLESQKNTIAQSVASMAQLGTDTTLSTSGMAADAAATGLIKSATNSFFRTGETEVSWVRGGLYSATGGESTSSKDKRCRTGGIPITGQTIVSDDSVRFYVYFYSGTPSTSTYLGNTGNWVTVCDVDALMKASYPDAVQIRVLGSMADDGQIGDGTGTDLSEFTDHIHIMEKYVPISDHPLIFKSAVIASDTDFNSVTDSGMYQAASGEITDSNNRPTSVSGIVIVMPGNNNTRLMQVYQSVTNNTYVRSRYQGNWTSWKKIADSAIQTLTENDDLDDVTDSGIYFVSSSSIPENMPADIGGIVVVFSYNKTYMIQIYSNAEHDFYVRNGITSGFTDWFNMAYKEKGRIALNIVKGSWMNNGGRATNVKSLCHDAMLQLIPGSVLEFYLDPGWTYTIWEGNSSTSITKTAHLSKNRLHQVSMPYVALQFNKFVNDESVDLSVDDFDESVVVYTSGDTMETTNEVEYHDMPASQGQLNVVYRAYQMSNIAYTPKATLPMHGGGSKSVTIMDTAPGTELEGVTYSSMRERLAYVPQAVSFHSFRTMIENPNSYIYTRHYEQGAPASGVDYTSGYDYNSRCYAGTVCSATVGYCYGIEDAILTTISFDSYPGFTKLPDSQQNPFALKIGDMLNRSGDHIVIVTDIVRTERGKIKRIEVSEAFKPLCRTRAYKPTGSNSIQSRYFDEEFVAYRYANIADVPYTPSPWVHIDNTETETPVYNTTLSPRLGEDSNWRYGDTVEIDVLDNSDGYTDYVVSNRSGDTVAASGAIPSGNLIALTGLAEGRYAARLTDGTNESDPVYFDVIRAVPTYTDQGNRKVRVDFTSAANRTPSVIYWCGNKHYADNPSNDSSDYKAVRAFHILTSEEISNGYAIVDEPNTQDVNRTKDTINGKWLMRMGFKTAFGLFSSDLEEVTVA